jgi:putative peptide zinc metalloprotease protein
MPTFLKQIGFAIFTFAIYSWIVNWKVALLLMVGVSFHECSHLWAARRVGLRTKGFYLVPFMGGAAIIDDKYSSYKQQAFVVLMGPVGGMVLALVTTYIWHITNLSFFAAAASWMCFLNLFNLLPLSFLDGGQLMDTLTYSINRTFGFVMQLCSTIFAIGFIWHYNPVISVIIVLFGLSDLRLQYGNLKAFRNKKFHLCTDSYMNPPKSLSHLDMTLTVIGWAITASILIVTRHYLSNFTEADFASLLRST